MERSTAGWIVLQRVDDFFGVSGLASWRIGAKTSPSHRSAGLDPLCGPAERLGVQFEVFWDPSGGVFGVGGDLPRTRGLVSARS